MKLCFICDEYPPSRNGGIGRFVQTLARALSRQGHSVRVVGNYAPADIRQHEDDQGVEVVRLFPAGRATTSAPGGLFARAHSAIGDLQARHSLFRTAAGWVRRGDVDLIEAPDYQGPVAHWPSLPAPIVVRLHGTSTLYASLLGQDHGYLSRSTRHRERSGIRRADFISGVSQYALDATSRLFDLDGKPASVLYSMAPVPSSPPAADRSRWVVVYNGTLTARKGVVSLIRAWPAVQQRCPDAELHLYGKDTAGMDGRSVRERLESMISPGSRVTFHGHVPRKMLDDAIASARACVFPSYAETFGLAPVEAMAAGCPTIYSSRCSGPEIIESGRSGILVDPDRPDEISGAILSLLLDDCAALTYAREGWKRARDCFSTEALLPRYESYYGTCVEQFQGRAS